MQLNRGSNIASIFRLHRQHDPFPPKVGFISTSMPTNHMKHCIFSKSISIPSLVFWVSVVITFCTAVHIAIMKFEWCSPSGRRLGTSTNPSTSATRWMQDAIYRQLYRNWQDGEDISSRVSRSGKLIQRVLNLNISFLSLFILVFSSVDLLFYQRVYRFLSQHHTPDYLGFDN